MAEQTVPVANSAGDQRAGALLRRCGYTSVLADAIVRTGAVLRSHTLAASVEREYAVLVDPQTARQWGPLAEGTSDAVGIHDLLRRIPAGQRFVALHTHRAGAPPSLRDVGVLLASPSLRSVIVVGVDGHWFVVTKQQTPPPADELDLRLFYTQALDELRPTYARFVVARQLTLDEADRRLQHTIWRLLVPHLGLRYDWTDPEL